MFQYDMKIKSDENKRLPYFLSVIISILAFLTLRAWEGTGAIQDDKYLK